MMGIRPYQRVALARDLPEYYLQKEDIAVVVEQLPPTEESQGEAGFALEVFNAVGETLDVVIVPESVIKPLSSKEVLHARLLKQTG